MTGKRLLALAALAALPLAIGAVSAQARNFTNTPARSSVQSQAPDWAWFIDGGRTADAIFAVAGAAAIYGSGVGPEGALAGALVGAA